MRLFILTTTAWLLAAVPVAAHPWFEPNQVPAGRTIETTLVIPHGCGPDGQMPFDNDVSPTVEFRLTLPEFVSVVAPGGAEGWTATTIQEGDRPVIVWSATEGGTVDPLEFDINVGLVADSDVPGRVLHLPAVQRCERGELAWAGAGDDELPAVRLTLIEEAAVPSTVTEELEHDVGDPHKSELLGDLLLAVAAIAAFTAVALVVARRRRAQPTS